MKVKSKVKNKEKNKIKNKQSTLEKVMGVSIVLLLIVGCPSSGSSSSTTPTPASARMCENGTPTPSTTDDATFCESCNNGFVLNGNLCVSVGMCENGMPTPSTTDDVAFCESCNNGFALSNNLCMADTDGDSVLDINELPSCGNNADCDGDGVADNMDVDDDNDGLIEISSLEMLHNMRFDLAGSSYKTSAAGTGDETGAPASAPASGEINNCAGAGLCGYELVRSLNFDGSDADDTTWTGGTAGTDSTFTLDMDDNNATYFPVANGASGTSGGWLPIGDASSNNQFTGIFEGNGFTISNLAISRSQQYVGFFGYSRGQIRNIGLINVLANSTSTSSHIVGGLVGQQGNNSSITASYTTGFVHAGDATGNNSTRVGGLVGFVSASHTARIIASYSTAHVNGGSGSREAIGGLVGAHIGNITSSYATGTIFGGSGSNDGVGGLVGYQGDPVSNIIDSYATGATSGGLRGRLIGFRDNGTDTHSFGFGSTGMGGMASTLGAPPSGITTALTLTAANIDPSDSDNDEWDTTVWDFGTTSQAPALNYADYDGSGTDYHCSNASNPPTRAILVVNCGTLIPGQR